MFFLLLLKKYIVSSLQNRLIKAILKSTHNLCFEQMYTLSLLTLVLQYKRARGNEVKLYGPASMMSLIHTSDDKSYYIYSPRKEGPPIFSLLGEKGKWLFVYFAVKQQEKEEHSWQISLAIFCRVSQRK